MRHNKFAISVFIVLLSTLALSQVKEGETAPEFNGTLVNGKYFSLYESVQDSIVVLFFMGYNCGICKADAPKVEQNIHRKYADYGVKVIGVDIWDGSVSLLKSLFINPTQSSYDFLPFASNVGYVYGRSISSFVIVGRDKIVKYVKSYYEESSLQETLNMLTTTAGEKPKVVPFDFLLYENTPNPFNPSTVIEFEVKVSEPSNAELIVYNAIGVKVKTLFSEQVRSGFYSVTWDGTNELGEQAPSGVYFYRLALPNYSDAKRMLLLR